jgi:hypothetical protein
MFCKNYLLYVIELLRNSLKKENQRIQFVIALFLSRLVEIIIEPGK